jgi:hypothetical protein
LIKAFLEADKTKLVKIITDDLTAAEKPDGDTEKDKIDNLLKKKNPDLVFKVIFSYKIKEEKDSTLINETQTKMETKKNGKSLDSDKYPKKDGKYTEKAMIRFLVESHKDGEHVYKSVDIPQDNPDSPSQEEKGFFSRDRLSGQLF